MTSGQRDVPEPQILLSAQRVACPGHGEHLRAQWPKGAAIVMVTLARAALSSDGLAEAARELTGPLAADAKLPVELINRVLERRPLCYFVERATIRRALLATELLRPERCDLCGIPRDAGPYSLTMPGGKVETRIVCVECALDIGERMHAALPAGGVWQAEGS